MNKVDAGDWVLVCDAAKALLFENQGDNRFPHFIAREVSKQDNPPTHEQGDSAPGRMQPRDGPRSAVMHTSLHEDAERQFLAKLVQHLDGLIEAGKIPKLIVVAPPRALAILRKAYSPALRGKLKFELGKDYVRHPVHEIERLIVG